MGFIVGEIRNEKMTVIKRRPFLSLIIAFIVD